METKPIALLGLREGLALSVWLFGRGGISRAWCFGVLFSLKRSPDLGWLAYHACHMRNTFRQISKLGILSLSRIWLSWFLFFLFSVAAVTFELSCALRSGMGVLDFVTGSSVTVLSLNLSCFLSLREVNLLLGGCVGEEACYTI